MQNVKQLKKIKQNVGCIIKKIMKKLYKRHLTTNGLQARDLGETHE